MKVAILSGTSRANNNTIRVAKAIQRLHDAKGDVATIVDFRSYDLPFFNGDDIDDSNPTAFQKELIDSWADAELVYVLSPEYNWMITAELTNMTNHYSGKQHAHLYDGKVFAFVGVSSGIGGRIPTMQLSMVFDKLIFFLHKHSVCSPNKFESHYTPKELDADGHFLLDSGYDKRLQFFVDYSAKLRQKFS